MPSRKKAKGKARKAAKEAKEKESREAVVGAAANQRQGESVQALMQQLRISASSSTKCWHGMIFPYEDGDEICLNFIDAFTDAFHSIDTAGQTHFPAAFHATKVEYANVYSSKLDTVISMLLSGGTQRIFDGDNNTAQLFASFASYFENYMAIRVHKSKASPNYSKIVELLGADDHSLVSYYRKHIPCSCLDEKYKEVKSVKKIGRCCNTKCRLPGGKVERSKMFCCTRCGEANYCSVECQRADWKKRHKQVCGKVAKIKAEFESNQT